MSYGGNTDQGTIRLDQAVSNKQQMFFRYTYWNDLDLAADAFHNQTYAGNLGTPETYHTLQAVIGDTYAFSPRTVMDIHADILRFVYARTPQSIGFDATSIGWPGYFNQDVAPQVRTLPNICLTQNYNEFCGGSTGSVLDAWDTTVEVHASVTAIHGNHTVLFGGEWRSSRQNYGQTNNDTGGYNFNQTFTAANPLSGAGGGLDFASFLYGTPNSGSVQEPAFTASQEVYTAGFVQDTYKASNRLTLTLGLRYEVTGPWTERFNRISVFLPTTPSPLAASTGLSLPGSVGLVNTPQRPDRSAVNTNYKEFSPRVGVAYLAGSSTTIRAGYGIFWLPIDVNLFSAPDHDSINSITESMNTSLNGGITPYNVLSNPFPNGIIPPPQRSGDPNASLYGQGITTQIPGNPLGYVQQWNFDIERQFGPSFLIDAAYVGSKGTHLPLQTQSYNYLPASDLALGTFLTSTTANPFEGHVPVTSPFNTATISNGQLLRPFPQFGSVTFASQGSGDSVYESFQLKMTKNFSAGGTALLTYTNSKLIGDVESLSPWLESYGPAGYQYWGNLRLERSLSSFDVPQRLVASYVVDVPVGKGKKFLSNAHGFTQAVAGGWGLDGTITLQSGFPLAFTTSQNNTHDLGGGSRPNYLAQSCPNGYFTHGSAESRLNDWFLTSCFAQPAPFTFGGLSRTMPNLRQDILSNWDFALFKNFGFGERLKLQLRGESFNLFNTPQFSAPNTSLGSQNFGVVTSQANLPRLIQVAAKLIW
ncbi:MAG: TonB-dependent receptor [Acidobacteriota bacterium]|nr:TonB-dependent receptor [Acidobacteriota bacterium]